MAFISRARAFACLSLLMIMIQCVFGIFGNLRAPEKSEFQRNPGMPTEFPVSVLQVAAAAYKNNPNIPEPLIKTLLTPGLIAHDLGQQFECHVGKNSAACSALKAMDSFDNMFELSEPMMRPDVITRSLKRAFGDKIELIQAGCSLTLGSALISLVTPAKMGFFGYAMLLFCVLRAGGTLLAPAFIFTAVFAVATDVFSIFSARGPRRAVENTVQATAASKKGGQRRAPRDTGPAADARTDSSRKDK